MQKFYVIIILYNLLFFCYDYLYFICRLSLDITTVYLSHYPDYAIIYGFKIHTYWYTFMVSINFNII